MRSLTLTFTSLNVPELLRISLVNSEGQSSTCLRGKVGEPFSDCLTFQWSTAVHALSLFFVRAAFFNTSFPLLEGEAGSAAASLDFALSKQPQWLLDMFGFDEEGNSLLRLVIRRSNSNRKRTGPVSLFLNEIAVKSYDISIFVDAEQIKDPGSLEKLALSLEMQWEMRDLRSTKKLKQEGASRTLNTWESIVKEELWQMLRGTDIFSRRSLSKKLLEISTNSSFMKIAGRNVKVVSDIDLNGSSSRRLGLIEREEEIRSSLIESGGLKFAVPISALGTTALINYLKYIKNYPIEICHHFPHTLEIRRQICSSEFSQMPDAFVLGSAPAAMLLAAKRSLEYTPFMLMPPGSQQIVAPRMGKDDIKAGAYLYMNNEPSTSAFYFEDLIRREVIDRKQISSFHLDPEDSLDWMGESAEDFRAILFYPYADLLHAIDACKIIRKPFPNSGNSDLILFVHNSLLRDRERAQFLNVILRDAWLTLLEEAQIFEKVVKLTANSIEYKRCVRRFAGLSLKTDKHSLLSGLLA